MMDYFRDKTIMITGIAGFIGTNFSEQILEHQPAQVIGVDDLSAGKLENIQTYIDSGTIEFHQHDIRDIDTLELDHNIDIIVHLAAQPSVPVSVERPYFDFEINVIGSMRLLEYSRMHEVSDFIFAASGGTVYGEADRMPTPEQYELRPISNYGAAKAAFEIYLGSYSSLYGLKSTSMRFGNIYGEYSTHGVMYDFFHKLKENPHSLEILGNGLQSKSYLYIDDCVSGFLHAASRSSEGFEAFNMGGSRPVTVNEIADLVSQSMGLDPEYTYTGGERGWKGDVRRGELDCTKLQSLGWKANVPIEDGVKTYIDWLGKHYKSN